MNVINKDFVIIGGGPGGYELAIDASNNGYDVTLIEKDKLGGTCLNYGCIPTKSYYHQAKVFNKAKVLFDNELKTNYQEIKIRKDKVIEDLNRNIETSLKGCHIIYGEAKLDNIDGKVCIKVNNDVYFANKIVIATGSKDSYLDIEGKELLINSKELLDLDYLPNKLVIIGGGVIGMEMASIYNALGVDISVIEYFPNILPRFDKEISRRLLNLLKQKGVKFYTSTSVYKVTKEDVLKIYAKSNDNEIVLDADVVLSCTGRIPNIFNLGLDNTNISYNKKGILVDENNETSVKGVYAIGDCIGGIMLAHKASFDGKKILNHLLGKNDIIRFENIPACCFSIPEIASIGLSEEECKERGIEYKVIKKMYRSNGKANAILEVDGFIKMIVKDNLIIGASVIGEEANLLIHEIMVLMNGGIKLNDAKGYIHAHPTLAEIIQECIRES